MIFSGKTIMSFCLTMICAWVVLTALKWPFRSALFPVVVGGAVLLMALTEFILSVRGKGGGGDASRMDFKLSDDIPPQEAFRKTVSIFSWLLGFFFLIILIVFQVSIFVFFILFLRLQGRESWGIALGLTAAAYGVFWFLFIWLLKTPLPRGLLLRGLNIF